MTEVSSTTPPTSTEQQAVTSSVADQQQSSRPIVAPLPVPASVVNQDTPYTGIPDYNAGYNLTISPVSTPAEAWTPAHIPLPTGVLNADEPWQTPQSEVSIQNSFEDIALRHGRTQNVEAGKSFGLLSS